MEVSLTSFQKDLGLVSAEIETLQSRSSALNTRLENRKIVEKLLGPAVEEISISPAVIRTITEGPIDDNWLKTLTELEKRSKTIESKMKAPDIIKAVADIKPLLDNLTGKVLHAPDNIHIPMLLKLFRQWNEQETTSWPRLSPCGLPASMLR